SGIGRAIAAEFARAGAEVIIHGRSAATAQTVVDAITARGGRARAVVADLSTEDGCAGLLAQTLPGGGSACPDIWV
ncbi:SDR family NAD(P)-dependent oxidoreductase, partial [Salmonella enterica]|uniref:SDR family NAD(P)-dependent oxidoreductase n=1 Tax=Salmonella enterica TaxID=28901 RepID=UPI003CEC3CF9